MWQLLYIVTIMPRSRVTITDNYGILSQYYWHLSSLFCLVYVFTQTNSDSSVDFEIMVDSRMNFTAGDHGWCSTESMMMTAWMGRCLAACARSLVHCSRPGKQNMKIAIIYSQHSSSQSHDTLRLFPPILCSYVTKIHICQSCCSATQVSAGPFVQGDQTGCLAGNGEKLSSSQAEPGQAIKSAVA